MANDHRPGKAGELVARRVLRTRQAAEYCGLAASTLEKMRGTAAGPRFIRLGRAVGYDVHDLDRWLDGQRERSDRRGAE